MSVFVSDEQLLEVAHAAENLIRAGRRLKSLSGVTGEDIRLAAAGKTPWDDIVANWSEIAEVITDYGQAVERYMATSAIALGIIEPE